MSEKIEASIEEWLCLINVNTKRIADALEKQNLMMLEIKKVDNSIETTEVVEEVLMDLTEVTVMAMTEKAILVTKKGYQKWLPLSTIEEFGSEDVNEGDFLEEIKLNVKASKWLPNKSWEPFKVVKK